MTVKAFNLQTSTPISRKGSLYAQHIIAGLVVAVLVSTGLMVRVDAAAGDLDPAFGSGGKVTTEFNSNGYDSIHGIAVQPDGKIVAAGYARNEDPFSKEFALARYRADGGLDTSFGSGGKVVTDFNQSSSLAYAVNILLDGKILVAGAISGNPALARYNIDGSLDTSFGSGGKEIVDFAHAIETFALAVQSDGRILLVGTEPFTLASFDFALYRFNANGSLDTSFGVGGAVYTDFYGERDIAVAVAIQPDGRIIAVGQAKTNSSNNTDFALARYNPDGSLDPTFGVGGLVTTAFSFSTQSYAGSVALLSGGRILVGGAASPAFALARYNSDGSLDTSFGIGGKAEFYVQGGGTIFPDSNKMAVQDDGKIILMTFRGYPLDDDFLTARFNADGSVDTSYGSAGTVVTDFFGDDDLPRAIATYGNDQIIVAGLATFDAGNSEFALARYLGDGPPTTADLSTAMSGALSTDSLGNRYITYTIRARNEGPNSAYYVTVKDRLPLETTFQSLTLPKGWTVYSKPDIGQWGTVSFSRNLFSPQTATITLVVKVHSTVSHAVIKNGATFFSGFTADSNTANNTASAQTNVP